MSKSKSSGRKSRVLWYQKDIHGTPKELLSAHEKMSKYLYRLLDYADKPDPVPKEVVDEEKRILAYCLQGPKAGHFRHAPRNKLTSADVIYILSSTVPSTLLGDKFGIDPRKVREIRSGQAEEWLWEWNLIHRLRTIIKYQSKGDNADKSSFVYSLSKVTDELLGPKKEQLYLISSIRKARKLREDILTKKDYNKLIKDNKLDYYYPIEKVEILK